MVFPSKKNLVAAGYGHWFKEDKNLPDGVHVLSQESQDIMKRIAERSAALEAGFTKRVS